MAKTRLSGTAPGNFRIIAGQWRGRRLPIPDQPGLRPTPDRVRETLFNWLAPCLPGARCLDLFAGAGALGMEAASRGAAQVVMVERSRAVAQVLAASAAAVGADGVEVVEADAIDFLRRAPSPFNILFVDPPYDSGLVAPVLAALAAGGWVAPPGRLYLEQPAVIPLPALPEGWTVLRSKRAGQVGYHLIGTPA